MKHLLAILILLLLVTTVYSCPYPAIMGHIHEIEDSHSILIYPPKAVGTDVEIWKSIFGIPGWKLRVLDGWDQGDILNVDSVEYVFEPFARRDTYGIVYGKDKYMRVFYSPSVHLSSAISVGINCLLNPATTVLFEYKPDGGAK